jgi:signal transduction histidine kinase
MNARRPPVVTTWRPARWPLIFKVPLLVATLMIAVALVISNIVLDRLAHDQKTNLAQLAGAYLDGLSTALLPYVQRKDIWESFDVLDRARNRYQGLNTRYSLVTLADGSVLAASDPHRFPTGTRLTDDVSARLGGGAELILDEDKGLAWVQRALRQEDVMLGTVVAEIDIQDLLAVRREVLLTLLLANAGLALLFAAIGYFAVRRMVRPVSLLTRHVDLVREGKVEPIPPQHVREAQTEFGRLFNSFNAMAAALREREELAARLAQEEKVALLGRLASGLAHEVNNPLGGMLNLVDTLRKHGGDESVRHRALDLLERGIRGIGNVVRATLVTYKGAPADRLARSDLDDLQFLLQHETGRRKLRLQWRNSLPDALEVDGMAVRQIALNLLLNACAASPEGALVAFNAEHDNGCLTLSVRDEGSGLPANVAAFLCRPPLSRLPPQGTVGLGIWTISLLVARLRGTASVDTTRAGGTVIVISLPIGMKEAKLDAVA